ncbi:hypothetical protein H8E88_24550 [candidate division KSB1 bacterium]|nr:hypothetical protein [candidate division KSB1 bacterium]MBL7092425.1 hypothetical protein [candidate division KSB1 bacterium]
MKTRPAPSIQNNFQISGQRDISPKKIQQKLEVLEMNLLNVQLTDQISLQNNFYISDAKKMLVFARENYNKGFFNVSDASLLLAKTYIERYKSNA